MQNNTKFIGLDVSKDSIAVAIANTGRDAARYYGQIANTSESVLKLFTKLSEDGCEISACYEAGPTGYGLHHLLTTLGFDCSVIAPSLIPSRSGDRVKTDRRDALRLAQLHRAGELVPIYVPMEDDEALRDLTRSREDTKQDQLRARHRLSKFLLRYSITPPENAKRKWSKAHREWLDTLKFEKSAWEVTFREYLQTLNEIDQRLARLNAAIHEEAMKSKRASLIQALQTLRGVKETTAVTLAVEIGSFERFASASDFMAYTGLVPSESSSGLTRYQGSITKTGNRHVRRVLVESAFSYRYKPGVKGDIRKRQKGQSAAVQQIAWKAQCRLHGKYAGMMSRSKPYGKVTTAVARELAGFVWAIGQEVERSSKSL